MKEEILLDRSCQSVSFSTQSQNVTVKSYPIYKKDENVCFILDLFGSYLSKMNQTWSN